MTFDIQKFETAKLAPREETVDVPDLRHFFAEGEAPVWRVRALEGRELADANTAADRVRAFSELIRKASGKDAKEQADAALAVLGFDAATPPDLARRHTVLELGSVEPKLPRRQAVKLAKYYPITFYQLTNKILELTGHGPDLGESNASGVTPECETPSHSAPGAPEGEGDSGSCGK